MEENNDFVIDTGMPVVPVEETPVVAEEETPVVAEEETVIVAEESPVVAEEAPVPAECSSPVSEGPTLAEIAALIEGLQKKFDEKIAVDEHKNGLFDKLYKERDEYKNDVYAKLLKPFVFGTIEIINDLRSYASRMENYDVERSLNYLRTLPDDLIELLENNGVELYEEEGDTFNPRTQRAKKVVPAEDASQNNKIAERLEKGYLWNGVVIRPEMVAVYRVKE